ncbi:MAG: hypothetical protein ACP5DC_11240 [Halothiobacillaceae bacterium]
MGKPIEPTEGTEINPATGLPMIGGQGGVDSAGNPYGSSEYGFYPSDLDHSGGLDSNMDSSDTSWDSSGWDGSDWGGGSGFDD